MFFWCLSGCPQGFTPTSQIILAGGLPAHFTDAFIQSNLQLRQDTAEQLKVSGPTVAALQYWDMNV